MFDVFLIDKSFNFLFSVHEWVILVFDSDRWRFLEEEAVLDDVLWVDDLLDLSDCCDWFDAWFDLLFLLIFIFKLDFGLDSEFG